MLESYGCALTGEYRAELLLKPVSILNERRAFRLQGNVSFPSKMQIIQKGLLWPLPPLA